MVPFVISDGKILGKSTLPNVSLYSFSIMYVNVSLNSLHNTINRLIISLGNSCTNIEIQISSFFYHLNCLF